MFSIIIAGVGLISFGAYDNISAFSAREQIENSERGLAAAASTLEDLHRQTDTQRQFQLALGGGSIYLNSSNITVSSPQAPGFNATYDVKSLEHLFDREPQDVVVSYEGGGVFRSPGADSRYQPSVRCRDEVAIVSLVRLEERNFAATTEGYSEAVSLNPRSIPEESPVSDLGRTLIFTAELERVQRNYTSFSGTGALHLNVSRSANARQWERYLNRTDSKWSRIGSSHVWRCENVDRALVRVITVRLSL